MAVGDHLFRNSLFLVILASVTVKCYGNDILGCGGFVKSHVPLDFSKIEIGLYTKAGSLKERTECAPTNGYYFLPLYEKGQYVLKVHPPAGWSFEPSEVDLQVDGTSDACSTGQDINFSFNGFGITGRVITVGLTQGPSGIAVQLINEKGEKRDTVTSAGGDFHFTPVIPGKYTLKASHSRWKLEPSQAIVQVKEGNTALPVGVLAVKGYDVKGSVSSFGSPISGVYVLLYSKEENPKYRVEGCKTSLLQGVPDAPICHSVTDAQGEFSFGLVPAGEYKLVALAQPPGQASLRYDVNPESVPFSVAHDSLYIKNAFEVTGFTVVGSVLSGEGETGVSGVRVLSDGEPVAVTDSAGRFTLPRLQPGVYRLSFQHEQCQVEELELSVTAAGPSRQAAAVAARWRVCGAVAPPAARAVALADAKGAPLATVHVSGEQGKWCTFLPPGVYFAKVEVSEAEQREGLQFYPLNQKIAVGHNPVDGILFSQLKATVTGTVQCKNAQDCENLEITLKPLSPEGGYVGQPMTTFAKNGEYSFEDVRPGSAEVSAASARLCWAEARHNVAVAARAAAVPPFRHRGYVLLVRASHDIQVEYVSKSEKGLLTVPEGRSEQCLPSATTYTLTPIGPHRFQPPSAIVDTTRPASVQFTAIAHAAVITVISPEPVQDLVLRISSEKGVEEIGPLAPRPHQQGGYALEHTLYMAEGEIAVISAQSSSLVFDPPGGQQLVGRREGPAGVTLRARRGLTLAGATVPPVAGATVTLTAVTGDVKLSQVTGEDGSYRFGPLDASVSYTITAEKESYVFSAPDDRGNIAAHRLAEISVLLVDEATGAPLQGALVSVSGGEYRRNAAAGADGRLRFPALSPAHYYVKPNMKEYRFSPPHHIVEVTQGTTHEVTLKGSRVAWSCMGRLVSLAGSGWGGRELQAAPAPAAPHCAPEEALTDTAGAFRIRGLVPGCTYTLQLKETAGARALTLAAPPPPIEIKDNKDIEGITLVALQPPQLTDVHVTIYTPRPEHYRTLRLTLAPDSPPTAPIYSTKLDATGYSPHINPGLIYPLPRLPADNKTYVLTLDSTLSKTTHSYAEEVIYFNSDGKFKAFHMEFLPKVKSSEQELRQTSFLVVPLLAMLALAYWQRDELLSRAARLASRPPPPARAPRPPRADLLDAASIHSILAAVNAAGKRAPKKKQQ